MKTTQIRILLVLIIIAALGYYAFTSQNRQTDTADQNSNDPSNNTTMRTVPAEGNSESSSGTELAEGEELPENLQVYEGWETVEGEGYYFMHPGYFIKEENGYYIIALDPVQGGEFSGLAINQPFEIEDIVAHMNETIENSESSVGINVTREPEMISVEGTKAAYIYEYELESGYNTGPGKFVALQSPSTDLWVTIQYPVGETAEAIRESFNFID